MSISVSGGTTLLVTGSTNTTISASFLVGADKQYGITGTIIWNDAYINKTWAEYSEKWSEANKLWKDV